MSCMCHRHAPNAGNQGDYQERKKSISAAAIGEMLAVYMLIYLSAATRWKLWRYTAGVETSIVGGPELVRCSAPSCGNGAPKWR